MFGRKGSLGRGGAALGTYHVEGERRIVARGTGWSLVLCVGDICQMDESGGCWVSVLSGMPMA